MGGDVSGGTTPGPNALDTKREQTADLLLNCQMYRHALEFIQGYHSIPNDGCADMMSNFARMLERSLCEGCMVAEVPRNLTRARPACN